MQCIIWCIVRRRHLILLYTKKKNKSQIITMTLGEFKNDNGMGWHKIGFTTNSIHFSPHSSKSNDVDQDIIKP